MAGEPRKSGRRFFTGAFALLVVGLLLTGTAAASGTCVSAMIEEPFVLPDGSEHGAARLSLCREATYSPVASLHEMRVNGMAVGMQISRRGTSETRRGDEIYMVFSRRSDGRLLLDAYTERASKGTTIYALRGPVTEVRTFMLAAAQGRTSPGDQVLIAARLD